MEDKAVTHTSYAGIDYGLGTSNIDKANGIRYGVIAINSLNLDCVYDGGFDAFYGDPTCPKCGNKAIDIPSHSEQLPDNAGVEIHCDIPASMEEWPSYSKHGCADFACETCEHTLDSSEVYSEEMLSMSYDKDGYKLESCFDNTELFVTLSPYYTFAQFCSPCAPGAGNLDNYCEDGAKTYCLGHDWFEDGKAPYPVYSVQTGELVTV
jgi:hypothetical protein